MFKIFLLTMVSMFSIQSFGATCGQFAGTYQGTMSNSNYTVNAAIAYEADCSLLSIHLYGVDRDYTSTFALGPASASKDSSTGTIHTRASLHDYTNLYLIAADVDGNGAQPLPQSTTVDVDALSLPTPGQLHISYLGGLLITFDGTKSGP